MTQVAMLDDGPREGSVNMMLGSSFVDKWRHCEVNSLSGG